MGEAKLNFIHICRAMLANGSLREEAKMLHYFSAVFFLFKKTIQLRYLNFPVNRRTFQLKLLHLLNFRYGSLLNHVDFRTRMEKTQGKKKHKAITSLYQKTILLQHTASHKFGQCTMERGG